MNTSGTSIWRASVNSDIFDGIAFVQRVTPPKNWAGSSIEVTYVVLKKEFSLDEYAGLSGRLAQAGFKNIRLICLSDVQLSSVFNPGFFNAITNSTQVRALVAAGEVNAVGKLCLNTTLHQRLGSEGVRYYLQSLIFLAGVTLSAAIIQNRWSPGTIDSKLAKLWQLSGHRRYSHVGGKCLKDLVTDVGFMAGNPNQQLRELKKLYKQALQTLAVPHQGRFVIMRKTELSSTQRAKFGFVDPLIKLLGTNLTALLVYGSSVNSDSYSDYDLMAIVNNSGSALDKLSGKCPTYDGKQLNIGVYDHQEFLIYQSVSGDNLTSHALCLAGEAEVPEKDSHDLLLRNFSFGTVRTRQLIGMSGFLASAELPSAVDDKKNLFEYFAKIPLNVVRGVLGSIGSVPSKEYVSDWCIRRLGFDVLHWQRACVGGAASTGLGAAAWATRQAMTSLNAELSIYS
ncbi:MAG TPA: hypothetical protein PLN52_21080 [Opitutaceae bacterium]|nr:hypothetical protein [Opitutaceae bacterium]